MLSSIILSLAVSTSPAPTADVVSLDVFETGSKRQAIRLNNKFDIQEAGSKRQAIRL